MAKTKPGIERITKRQLQALAIWAEREMRRHSAACLTCKRAGTNTRKRCGHWWELARRAHRARRALKQYAQPETANINPLPGIE